MKTASSHIINKNFGIQNTISHHIKSENYGIIFNILRKQLYTDLILAPIREISANAVDAHVEAGKAKTPIKVTLPTLLDSFFKVRDYGFGLSDDKIAELYSGYGDSNKRNTNDAIGGFGIGKFAPLAYGDSFIINSYQNGTVHSWNSYIDASNRGAMSKMGSAPTTEPNGMEIIVPVKGNDINAFHEKAINLFAYFDVTPELINATPEDITLLNERKDKTAVFSGSNYRFTGQNWNSLVVMGGIPYKIDSSTISADISFESKIILDAGVILNFNIGELEIAASRETLNYSNNTKKKLAKALEAVATDIIKQVNDSFKNCATLWDAKRLHQEVFDYYGKLYPLRRFFDKNLVYKGVTINSGSFFSVTEGVRIMNFSKNQNYRNLKRVRGVSTDMIVAKTQNIVVEDDIKASNGILNRVVPIIEAGQMYKNVYVVSFADAQTRQDWFKDTSFDGPMIKLSSLPKEPLSNYYGTSDGSNASIKNKKHTKKEFIFNFNFKPSYSSKASEWYETADVDISNDSGVYLIIDRFNYLNKSGLACEPAYFKKLYKEYSGFNINFPTVYCIKNSQLDKIKANPKMISFWDWLENQIKESFKNDPVLLESASNHHEWSSDDYTLRATLRSLARMSKVRTGMINDFFNHVIYMYEHRSHEFYNLIQSYISEDVFKPTYNIKAEFEAVRVRYPVFGATVKHISEHSIGQEEASAFDGYFNLIDKV